MQKNTALLILVVALLAFLAGRSSSFLASVKADSTESPRIEVQPIRGDTSLTIYYPSQNKLYVYQNPFAGLPTWNCSYSIQLGTPGGKITRQSCNDPGQQF